ncbi:DUF6194 family protein [Pseudonocardia sp. NPDC049154]|uniref:DUF6194 family protein n=1 Tax=Pseudonocardia sp. NPDC049154 TaxID=3155501 RepID=UPI0033E73A86
MIIDELSRTILTTCPGAVVLEAAGDLFFVHDPEGDLPDERKQPFVTIVTGGRYDDVSDLDRPGVYRLDVGVSRARFGQLDLGTDLTTLDVFLPHPIYASQHWICVLNPGARTVGLLDELIVEAHGLARRKVENWRARRATRAADAPDRRSSASAGPSGSGSGSDDVQAT